MEQLHAALVNVLGVGVLLRGDSAVGKSECALELVQRGHCLVADDVVQLEPMRGEEGEAILVGRSPGLIRHYMEIRGIGLLNIADLYGLESVMDESSIDLICALEAWDESAEYERIGLDRPSEQMLGVAIPSLRLPVRPARSMATLVEVAVRDGLRRKAGVNGARVLDRRLSDRARSQSDRSGEEQSDV